MEKTRVALLDSISQFLDQSEAFTIAKKMKAAKRLVATFFSHKHHRGAAAVIPIIAYQLALAFPRIRHDILEDIETKRCSFHLRNLDARARHQTTTHVETPLMPSLSILSMNALGRKVWLRIHSPESGPDLSIIHLIFTSRPETQICAAMQAGIQGFLLFTSDKDTI